MRFFSLTEAASREYTEKRFNYQLLRTQYVKGVAFFFWRGVRALLPILITFFIVKLLFEAFLKINFSILPNKPIVNISINLLLWCSVAILSGWFIGKPFINDLLNKMLAISPRLSLLVKMFSKGNASPQKNREVIFESAPGTWKLGIEMLTFNLIFRGKIKQFSFVLESTTPIPLTGALYIKKTEDLIPTGRTIENTALTIVSLGTNFDISPDIEIPG